MLAVLASFVVTLRLTIKQKEFAMSLVITRKSGQSFSVGDAIITLQIENGQVRVVIDAPREMNVVRSELMEDNPRQ
jgi:carbon storage regulator CsrA